MLSTNSSNCTVQETDREPCLIRYHPASLPENLRALSVLIIIPFILLLMPAKNVNLEDLRTKMQTCIHPGDYLVIR